MSEKHPLFKHDFKPIKEYLEVDENYAKEEPVKNIYSKKQSEYNCINEYDFHFHDVECDPIICNISVDGLQINTEDYKHILLDEYMIHRLWCLLQEFQSELEIGEKNVKIL